MSRVRRSGQAPRSQSSYYTRGSMLVELVLVVVVLVLVVDVVLVLELVLVVVVVLELVVVDVMVSGQTCCCTDQKSLSP